MEDAFNKLKRENQNSVDNLIKWMQNSKIVAGDKKAEENARKLFEGVQDTANVELKKFKEALDMLAVQQQKSAKEFAKKLTAESEKFLEAAIEAAAAAAQAASATFKENMAKKK